MKRRRPLITKHDLRKLVAQARKTFETLKEPVQVLPLLRSFYPERKITNQMRRILSAALDKAGIDRAKRQDSAMPRSLTSRRAILKPKPAESPVPAVLGGMTGEIIDVSFSYPTDELDDFLADEASKGNRRALRLLKIQIGRG